MAELVTQAPEQRGGNADRSAKQRARRHAASDQFATRLLQFEGEVRSIADERELCIHLCNSTRELLAFSSCFYGVVRKGRKSFRLTGISSVPIVDRSAPFTHRLEATVSKMIADTGGMRQIYFRLDGLHERSLQNDVAESPIQTEFLWTPQISEEQLVSGFIVTRDNEWSENDLALIRRLGDLYLHTSAAIKGRKSLVSKKTYTKQLYGGALLLLAALGFLPVPISALAPVEVTPSDAFYLTAPFDGVVKTILPSQGMDVSEGEVAVVFDDVHLLNNKQIAEQEQSVAAARYQQISQGAIADHRVKREIEVAKAEFELAQAESDYANHLYAQSKLATPVKGVAVFSDKKDWEGKPVQAGEAIMSIANPDNVEFTIDLPVKESLVLEQGAKVRIFLDSDPLHSLDAVLVEANYGATPDKRDVLSYTLKATLADSTASLPRIGVQGTAQVFGEQATLAYLIFRRPYSALRQLTGW